AARERRQFAAPLWDGTDPAGRTILAYTEQGFGDAIQFARYASLLAAQGATVILECQPALQRLLMSLPEVSEVIPRGKPLPWFDTHIPLMSLPRIFATTLKTIPRQVPYVAPPVELVRTWRRRIQRGQALRVGLTWAANPSQRSRLPRSVSLAALAPLADVRGIRFYSLQKERESRVSMDIKDLSLWLDDFAETAAAVSNLDLVITVDTAVAHLAGALGRR